MTIASTQQNALTNWVFNTFKEKASFDIGKKYSIRTNKMVNDYVYDCSYAITVQLRTSSVMKVEAAQIKLHNAFDEYSSRVLGPQCMDIGKLTSRTRPFLPLIFLALDIEGTRQNHYDVVTANPHGHGVIMFDEHTVFNFRNANARFRCEDGSYKIVNPTREIALIKLVPFCSISGVKEYIHYSLKYAAKLLDNQINLRPYDFYPPKSVNYPFWQYLNALALETHSPKSKENNRDALEQVWEGDYKNRDIRGNFRYGKSGNPDRYFAI